MARFLEIAAAIVILLPLPLSAGEPQAPQEVHGRVIDENGKPVAGAHVSWWWRANGPPPPEHSKGNFDTPEAQRIAWGNLGKMEPWHAPATTDADGRFTFSFAGGPQVHYLMAMNAARTRGGLVIWSKDKAAQPIDIRLASLTRVKGSLEGPAKGERPGWTFVYTLVPDDAERPLETTRLAGCGSVEARFEMALPAGRYLLNAYSFRDKDNEKADVVPDTEVVVTGKVPEIDVGVLHLSPFKPTITARKERAKAAGTWGDYTRHYGEKLPQWHVVDARGVKKDVQIADFKGKWVLLDFWGLSCRPCLSRSMPKLMKFYEAHQAQRDQFEILAICIDEDGELQSIGDLDKKLRPIVEHVWGRTLPFPVLLDPTFQTWERYGLPGLGTLLLIDPEGNLVKGDETVLAEKLMKR
jgi:hypothetical protein